MNVDKHHLRSSNKHEFSVKHVYKTFLIKIKYGHVYLFKQKHGHIVDKRLSVSLAENIYIVGGFMIHVFLPIN